MFHAARAGAALLLCGAAGLLLAMGATGASAHTLKKPPGPPGRPTTTVTTTTTTTVPTTTTATVSTTTTVSSTTTASSPPAAAPPQPTADIALTMLTAPGPVYADTSVTYTSVVTNAGPDTATGVFLDVTPIGARVASSQPSAGSCSATDGLQCALGALVTGASAVVSVTYVPDAGSTAFVVDGRAGAEQADPQTANNLSRSLTGVLAGHAGPPVLMSTAANTFAPPLVAAGKGSTRTLATSLHIDEQSVVYVRVYDGTGKQIAMLPGTLVDYRPAQRTHVVIPQTIASARWLALRLRVPITKTHSYRIVLRAVGADGAAATATIMFLS